RPWLASDTVLIDSILILGRRKLNTGLREVVQATVAGAAIAPASATARAWHGRLRFRRRLRRRDAGRARQGRILAAAARALHAGLPRVARQAATFRRPFARLRRRRR